MSNPAPVSSAIVDHATAADVANNTINHLANGSDQILQKGSDLVKSIAFAAQTAAPQVWGVLVRQQAIIGITNICIFIFMLITLFVMYKFTIFAYKKCDGFGRSFLDLDLSWAVIPGALTVILSIVIFINFINEAPETIGRLLNPSYYAATDLIDRVQGKKPE